ncbi:MAG: hypothetical protein ACRYF5_10730 [Janthinobacterium lividum]
MGKTVSGGLTLDSASNHDNGSAAASLPSPVQPHMLARSGMPLLPGAPFDHLPGEVQNLVLRRLEVPDLLRLQGVSVSSNGCIHGYVQLAMTPAQTRHWNDLRQRALRRQRAYSSQLFGTIWKDASCAPGVRQKAGSTTNGTALSLLAPAFNPGKLRVLERNG